MGYGYGTSDARGYVNARDARKRLNVASDLGSKPDNALRRCDGIVSRRGIIGQCKRRAAVEYDVRDARGTVAYCREHDNGGGIMHLLRPFPWETTDRREI